MFKGRLIRKEVSQGHSEEQVEETLLTQVPHTESPRAGAPKDWAERQQSSFLQGQPYVACSLAGSWAGFTRTVQDRPESLSMKKIWVLAYSTRWLNSNLKSTPKILSDTYKHIMYYFYLSLWGLCSLAYSPPLIKPTLPDCTMRTGTLLSQSCLKITLTPYVMPCPMWWATTGT